MLGQMLPHARLRRGGRHGERNASLIKRRENLRSARLLRHGPPGVFPVVDGKNLLKAITRTGAFCDSDKYSFVLAFSQVLGHLPQSILKLAEEGDALPMPLGGEVSAEEQRQPAFLRRACLQNLYRFFAVHIKNHRKRCVHVHSSRSDMPLSYRKIRLCARKSAEAQLRRFAGFGYSAASILASKSFASFR